MCLVSGHTAQLCVECSQGVWRQETGGTGGFVTFVQRPPGSTAPRGGPCEARRRFRDAYTGRGAPATRSHARLCPRCSPRSVGQRWTRPAPVVVEQRPQEVVAHDAAGALEAAAQQPFGARRTACAARRCRGRSRQPSAPRCGRRRASRTRSRPRAVRSRRRARCPRTAAPARTPTRRSGRSARAARSGTARPARRGRSARCRSRGSGPPGGHDGSQSMKPRASSSVAGPGEMYSSTADDPSTLTSDPASVGCKARSVTSRETSSGSSAHQSARRWSVNRGRSSWRAFGRSGAGADARLAQT